MCDFPFTPPTHPYTLHAPTGAMRSHMHFDQSKDTWSVELKIPRHMAPVTLGFVLWNSGKTNTGPVQAKSSRACVCVALVYVLRNGGSA